MAKNQVHAEVVNPDDDKDIIHITTGTMFKPPIWSFRKAVAKLSELYPGSVATDLWMIIKDRPYSEQTQYEWMGYRDDVVPHIWFLYTEFKDVRKNPVVTVCLWVIRCSHYYWFGGPRPERKYQPRKKNKKSLTESWRDNLVCPTCKSIFTYDGLLTDTREEVMLHYNNWLEGHTKVCANLTWNKIELDNRKKVAKKVEKERLAREKQRESEYQEWLAKMGENVKASKQERDSHMKSLDTMEKALNIITELDKNGKKVEVIHRLSMLIKYAHTHRPSEVIRKRIIFLSNKYNINHKL